MSHIAKATTVDRDPYDNRAISIYEDAVQRGIVAPPQFQTEICDLILTKTMPAVGEVALLYVLRHLRKHPYTESFDIHIHTQPVADLEGERKDIEEQLDTQYTTQISSSYPPQNDNTMHQKSGTSGASKGSGSIDGRYQKKNLYKSKLAAHAVLAILRRLNITYEHNRKTGLVVISKSALKPLFMESTFNFTGMATKGYPTGNTSGRPIGSMIQNQQRNIRSNSDHIYKYYDFLGD